MSSSNGTGDRTMNEPPIEEAAGAQKMSLKLESACREMGREVLRLLNQPGSLEAFCQRIIAALRAQTGFDAVGIRLQNGDDFPYFAHDGFSKSFLLTENSLLERAKEVAAGQCEECRARLECTCGLVISGTTDLNSPLFTAGGSFWTNDSALLLSIPLADDPRHHPRNRCIHDGYSTMVLVPIPTQEGIVGLIQLNNRSKGSLTRESVESLEGIAAHIGEAFLLKRTEEKLIAAQADLLEALVRAETAATVKAEFLSVMSHELRTPLNGVLGFAEILDGTVLDDAQRMYLKTIADSGNNLLSVIDNILDFSSMEKGALAMHSAQVDIAGLVKASELAIRKSAMEKGIRIRCDVAPDVPKHVSGDERRIHQILFNLLGNAVKFSPSGSIFLRVAVSLDDGRTGLDFIVEDAGIGISPETLARLFNPFTQADSTIRRQFGGAGLGLAISRRLAEAMGGSISVVSTLGKGSTFTLRLPYEPSAIQGEDEDLRGSPVQPGKGTAFSVAGDLVFVVEDDPTSSKLAGAMLESLGYKVEFADNGHEALQAFQKGKFAAILMDMQMPIMDGLVATRKIREVESVLGGHVPIIALTANVLPSDLERCLAAGMDDFLTKPFRKDDIAAKLSRGV